MRGSLPLVLPAIFAATRSLTLGIRSSGKSRALSTIPAETEYHLLLVIIFSLTGLLVSQYLMIQFPELSATIAELEQF